MISKKELQYKKFGRCLEISNDVVRIVVTLDFGPRIICYSFINGENIFFEDTEKVFSISNSDMEEAYGKDSVWRIYGGHRLWTSPEKNPQTYYPDNDPVSYECTTNGAVFTPPVQKWTQYGFSIGISMSDNSSDVVVEHRITNHGVCDAEFSAWAITALSQGGTELVPQPTRKMGATPKMRMAFWDYSKLTDKRLTLLNRYLLLRQDINVNDRMKFGINCSNGYAMYFNHGDLFIKRFDVKSESNYPDGGMSFETFTNPIFLEMETLSELKTVSPGSTLTHTEKWSLYKEEIPNFTDDEFDILNEKYKCECSKCFAKYSQDK